MSAHDAIIVGAGHNGLVCAAYLARAGKKVLVLERRDRVGGAATTEEIHPGFRASTGAYLVSLFQPKIVADLDLHAHGYEVIPKDPAYFAPFPDGRSLFMWRDMARTCQEIARFSTRDAERYPRYEAFLDRVVDRIRPWLLRPPPEPGELFDGDADMWRMVTGSVRDLLDRWFESEQLKVALASDGVIGHSGGPRSPGTSYVLLHHQMGEIDGARGRRRDSSERRGRPGGHPRWRRGRCRARWWRRVPRADRDLERGSEADLPEAARWGAAAR